MNTIDFNFDGDQPFRVCGRGEDSRPVAADLCRILGLGNPAMACAKLAEDEKGISSIDTLGGPQQVLTVTLSGMFTLVLRCRDAMTPGSAAYRFRRWVTGEVLPALFHTGRYEVQGTAESLGKEVREHTVREYVVAAGLSDYGQRHELLDRLQVVERKYHVRMKDFRRKGCEALLPEWLFVEAAHGCSLGTRVAMGLVPAPREAGVPLPSEGRIATLERYLEAYFRTAERGEACSGVGCETVLSGFQRWLSRHGGSAAAADWARPEFLRAVKKIWPHLIKVRRSLRGEQYDVWENLAWRDEAEIEAMEDRHVGQGELPEAGEVADAEFAEFGVAELEEGDGCGDGGQVRE